MMNISKIIAMSALIAFSSNISANSVGQTNVSAINVAEEVVNYQSHYVPEGMSVKFKLPIGIYLEYLSKDANYEFNSGKNCDLGKKISVKSDDMTIISQLNHIALEASDKYEISIFDIVKNDKKINLVKLTCL
jgi:hypothetical protein